MEQRKPQAVSQKLDVVKQKAFIEAYETLMNMLSSHVLLVIDCATKQHVVEVLSLRRASNTHAPPFPLPS